MASRVTEVVAQELGLTSFMELPPKVSMLGVTSVEIESEGKRFRLYLVKDTNEEVTNSLEECARLCAYYNSRFVLQYVRANKIDYPVGQLQINFQIEDMDQMHSVYVLQVAKGEPTKTSLTLDELEIVAANIAKLHGKTAESLGKELYNTINANYENVHHYEQKIETDVINILKESLHGDYARYFLRPHDITETLDCLIHEQGKVFQDIKYKEVICHGNLTASNCVFGDGGKRSLVEITDWETVHFGDPTEDLTSLIINSADTETRRHHFMQIFRSYYYALIELRPLKFNLADLKHLYRKNSKKTVLSSVESLLNILSSEVSKGEKIIAARRWEAALYDVYNFEFGDYISDDEQPYFEK